VLASSKGGWCEGLLYKPQRAAWLSAGNLLAGSALAALQHEIVFWACQIVAYSGVLGLCGAAARNNFWACVPPRQNASSTLTRDTFVLESALICSSSLPCPNQAIHPSSSRLSKPSLHTFFGPDLPTQIFFNFYLPMQIFFDPNLPTRIPLTLICPHKSCLAPICPHKSCLAPICPRKSSWPQSTHAYLL